MYSENFSYFETCVTQKYSDPPSLPQKLLGAISTNLEQIEFPLKFDNHRSEIKEASIKTAKRFKAEFKLPSTHLPNLNTTHVDIFCTYTQPCQRLLVCPVLYTPANFSPERRLAPFRAPIAKRHRSQRFSKSIFTIALKCCYSMALSVFYSWNGVLEIATLHIRTDNSTMAGKPGSTSNETSVTRPGIWYSSVPVSCVEDWIESGGRRKEGQRV